MVVVVVVVVVLMLGKQVWTIIGDSKKCFKGKTYTRQIIMIILNNMIILFSRQLKLTGCKIGEFTCDDGQCILMEERCNQVGELCDILLGNGSMTTPHPPKVHLGHKISYRVIQRDCRL